MKSVGLLKKVVHIQMGFMFSSFTKSPFCFEFPKLTEYFIKFTYIHIFPDVIYGVLQFTVYFVTHHEVTPYFHYKSMCVNNIIFE